MAAPSAETPVDMCIVGDCVKVTSVMSVFLNNFYMMCIYFFLFIMHGAVTCH